MRSDIVKFLLKSNSIKRNTISAEKRALHTYSKNYTQLKWYNELLPASEKNGTIKTVSSFKTNVPIISKNEVFKPLEYGKLVKNQKQSVQLLMLSSGQTGNFSLGVITKYEYRKMATSTDLFLELFFGIKRNEALVINASAMGVRVFTNHTFCDTGPRTDLVIALLKFIAPSYKKVIITADPHLIKSIAEESITAGVNWEQKIWLISGGDWFSETLRTYVHHLIGKNASKPENGYWSAIYGLTELGYPLLFETSQLAVLRNEYSNNRVSIISELDFKNGLCTTPFFFNYLQSSFYIESIYDKNNVPELVFTTLSKSRVIPLVRYNTGDIGEMVQPNFDSISDFQLPIVSFWGRNNNWVENNGARIFLTDIKELLFSKIEIACEITGFFTIAFETESFLIEIQLKKNGRIDGHNHTNINQLFKKTLKVDVRVIFCAYYDFRQQMELDFEHKFNHQKVGRHG